MWLGFYGMIRIYRSIRPRLFVISMNEVTRSIWVCGKIAYSLFWNIIHIFMKLVMNRNLWFNGTTVDKDENVKRTERIGWNCLPSLQYRFYIMRLTKSDIHISFSLCLTMHLTRFLYFLSIYQYVILSNLYSFLFSLWRSLFSFKFDKYFR